MSHAFRRPNTVALLSLFVAVFLAASCGGDSRPAASATGTAAAGTRRDSANPLLTGPAVTAVRSPEVFRATMTTSRGVFVIEVQRALSPRGADRFYEMVTSGYFSGVRFFRVVPGFVAQFGMHGEPDVNAAWQDRSIVDEPRRISNARGTIVFATTPDPNSRANQLFLNLVNNAAKLDGRGFAPFGRVVEGLEVVDQLNSEYGETVNQNRLASKGNAYLRSWFPALDSIVSAVVVAPADSGRIPQ